MDADSSAWLEALRGDAGARGDSESRLHRLLLGVAHAEANRRTASLPPHTVADLADLCLQSANDALMAILRKLDSFQGLSRFTTWAAKFVILEISSRLRRHAWRGRRIEWSDASWDRLRDSSPTADEAIVRREDLDRVRHAVEHTLTEKQRTVLTAAALDDVPIDVLAERMGSSRGAIYKILHDARARLRATLTPAARVEELS